MATYNDDLTAIRTRFRNQWEAATTTPFIYDDEPAIAEPEGIWVRFSVIPGAERRRSIATKSYEQLGRVYLQIFLPRANASVSNADGWALANTFSAIFRDWRSADYRIAFDVPQTSVSDDEADYYMILVSVPYTALH